MQRRYNLAYFVFALGLTTLVVGVDAQAQRLPLCLIGMDTAGKST